MEAKNEADALIYSIEKLLRENEGKIDPSERQNIESAVANLRKAMESDDETAIKTAKSQLEQASHKFAERMYRESASQQSGAAQGPGAGPQESGRQDGPAGGAEGEKVVDADYEVVDDDKK